jgi:ubiquinone/menaquinone biosynthesis C-methylase UbiE
MVSLTSSLSADAPPMYIGASTASLPYRGEADVSGGGTAIPFYLTTHYWWAYVHPLAVKVFERQWLVNLILWGNYARLRDAALADLEASLSGNTLQVACVYGDLTNRLSSGAERALGSVDIVDVLPVQLRNLRAKLPKNVPVRFIAMDAAALELPDASYDSCLLFFLLHEQPRSWRERTLSEVLRVVKPGGKIVIVDYARPRWWHPLRYLWRPLLAKLEPFALDLWREEIADWLPPSAAIGLRKAVFFGGLYQKLVITRQEPAARVMNSECGTAACCESA